MTYKQYYKISNRRAIDLAYQNRKEDFANTVGITSDIVIDLSSPNEDVRNQEFYNLFSDIPFYIKDPDLHKKLYDDKERIKIVITRVDDYTGDYVYHIIHTCCFNHMVGLPTNPRGEERPLWDYQLDLIEKLNLYDWLFILKATGLGITELMIRYMSWLSLIDKNEKEKQMVIVTGPNINLAVGIMKRLKSLFEKFITFKEEKTVIYLKYTEIKAYPSHNVSSFRALTNPQFILVDEGDFFIPSQQTEVLDASQRYELKGNPKIVLISTPHKPQGLFYKIHHDPKSKYHKIFLDYTYGVGKVYDPDQIAEAQKNPSFPREYKLQYSFGVGNLFSELLIENAIRKGNQIFRYNLQNHIYRIYAQDKRTGTLNEITYSDLPALDINEVYNNPNNYLFVNPYSKKVMGIDVGYGSSNFAITITERDENFNVLNVAYHEVINKGVFEDTVRRASLLYKLFGCTKCYVDGSASSFIRSLKKKMRENIQYEKIIETLRTNLPSQITKNIFLFIKQIGNKMSIIPVNFNQLTDKLTERSKQFIDNKVVAIPSIFNNQLLCDDLRIAQIDEKYYMKLTKDETLKMDSFDSWKLSLTYFNIG